MSVTYYTINEDTACNAHYCVHMSDYKPGSATAEYRASVDEAAALVEREMKKLIQSAYDSALKTLRENAALLNHLAEYLLLHENITGDEFMQLVHERAVPNC